MTSTANRRRKVLMPMDIKKKFAAAICMLLIAAIMMISSTYAWFTLSTAPEVTGITTNIGANGNLEIALLEYKNFNSNTPDLGIQTNVGDSMAKQNQDVMKSNTTWGNLVDLSDGRYGLSKIILNPSALNILSQEDNIDETKLGGYVINSLTSPLLAPEYGADGRIMNVQKKTTTGIYSNYTAVTYENGKFGEYIENGTAKRGAGVLAVGVSSGITVRIASYRAALSAVSANINSAKAAAQASLVNNGQALASLLVTAVANDQYQLTADDVAAINAVKTDLNKANTSIANAIRQAALAKYLSAANTAELSDSAVAEKVAEFESAELGNLTTLAGEINISFLDSIITACNAIQSNIDSISVTEGQTYASMANQIGKLIDRQYVLINGLNGSELTSSDEDISKVVSAVMAAGQVELTMKEGSGIYADIAKIVGDYTASGLRITVSANGLNVKDMNTVMTTQVGGTAMLTTALNAAAAGDPDTEGGTTAVDDTYGYMLDFGFRTNAAGSTLLLQQDEAQRIYSDSQSELTKGSGTYIEFTTSDKNVFTADDVTALMSAVRIVFLYPDVDNNRYEIIGIAAPNLKTSVNAGGAREVGLADTRIADELTLSEEGSSATVRAKLYMYDIADVTVDKIVQDKEYVVTLGKIKATEEGEGDNKTYTPDLSIVELEQNTAKKITALVYIDGDIVDNTMVANAATSMEGKINLQFASDAELKPMENTELMESGEQAQTYTKAQLDTAVEIVKANDKYSDAVTAGNEGSEAQKALVAAVSAAEALANDAETEAITEAAQNLITACSNAEIANPFVVEEPTVITKENLSAAITEIKKDAIYTDAEAASSPSDPQNALLSAVSAAEAVVAQENPTQDAINSAAMTLGAAYVAAGGTNPFA